jgi:hypothetical protein
MSRGFVLPRSGANRGNTVLSASQQVPIFPIQVWVELCALWIERDKSRNGLACYANKATIDCAAALCPSPYPTIGTQNIMLTHGLLRCLN